MLGQPVSMLIPQVVGFKLHGQLPEGATATDLVLTVTQMLRKKGVVGKFVEFFGPGLDQLPLADRATIANMAPEYGATCGIFPVDAETLAYLRLTGRPEAHVRRVEAYCKEQGLFRTAASPDPIYTDAMELDLAHGGSLPGRPSRPQDRVAARATSRNPSGDALPSLQVKKKDAQKGAAGGDRDAWPSCLRVCLEHHGSVVIAAITSCTNTSNPSVLVAAGLVAKKAAERGLATKPWVKTSLAPGSKAVTEYLDPSRPDALARTDAFLPGGLWLHDLHRQQRSLAAGDFEDDCRSRTGGVQRPQRQSQFRGPRPSRSSRQLSRLAAAGRRLCPRRPDRLRFRHRAARHRARPASRSFSRTFGRRRRKCSTPSAKA